MNIGLIDVDSHGFPQFGTNEIIRLAQVTR